MTSSIPYISLFSSTLILGTIISISSTQWIYIWIGLELNLLSFIPLVTRYSTNRETEAAVKYFLAQAIGSGLLLLGAFNKSIIFFINNPLFYEKASSFLILTALLIKLGAAPCHFWFPIVISNISWPLCIILSTWQKLAPLTVFIYSNIRKQSIVLMILARVGSLIGGVGGINQTQLRPLLAYSSIGHIGWMIASPSIPTLILYLWVYIGLSISIIALLWNISSKTWSPKLSSKFINSSQTFTIIILLLSLSGLPPFLGFLPKWIILASLINYNISIIWALILIIGSTIQLYYYISLILSLFLKTKHYFLNYKSIHTTNTQLISLIVTLTLGVSPIFLIICALILFN